MGIPSRSSIPVLRHHKSRNLAYVRVAGKMYYLGRWETPETLQRYQAWLHEFLASGQRVPDPKLAVTVAQLAAAYLKHAGVYYANRNGLQSSHGQRITVPIRDTLKLYAELPVEEFGPIKLKAVRQIWLDRGLCRKTINEYTSNVRAMFKWGVAEELLKETVWRGLTAVDGLKYGRSTAKESREVKPVPDAYIEKVKAAAPSPVRALIDLQLLTGARPGELLSLRASDIDRSGKIWVADLKHHKTAYRKKTRTLYFGPQAQAILRPILLRRPFDAPLFSPKEAETERHAAAPTHRRPDQKPNRRKTDRTLGDSYTVDSYRKSIEHACERAEVPRWHPYQLRHNAATRIRKEFGLEAAQAVLGHARADVTEIYAEVNAARAIAAVEQLG